MPRAWILGTLAVAALWCGLASANNTISVLQYNHKDGGENETSLELSGSVDTWPSTDMTAGSTILVALSCEDSAVSGITVVDSKNSGDYTADANSGALSGSGGNGGGLIAFFRMNNTYGGVSTAFNITVSWTTAALCTFTAYEVTASSAIAFDLAGTPKSGTGSLTSLGFTITPSGASELVINVGLSDSHTGVSADSGYTLVLNAGGSVDWHMHEYDASASGEQSLTLNGTGSGGASMYAVAYKSSSSPSVSPSQFFFGAFLAPREWVIDRRKRGT